MIFYSQKIIDHTEDEAKTLNLCLPVVVKKNSPLIFRRWHPGDQLVDAAFDTKIPNAEQEEIIPDWIIVPLLGFNTEGYRLGYGGG